MHTDVVDLREFYLSPLGLTVRRLMRAHMRRLWPSIRGDRILSLGYGVPLLRPLLSECPCLMAMMPAELGVAYWPREGPNISCFVDDKELPLPSDSVDRVILMHGLESSQDPKAMLREVWRVMKSGGRLLLVLPNRHGLWAHSDRTPFGTGQPFSNSQIRNVLRSHGFLIERVGSALFLPPTSSRLLLSCADRLEKIGVGLMLTFGGVLVVEAEKQLYAPLSGETKPLTRRLLLTLPPLPTSPSPIPT